MFKKLHLLNLDVVAGAMACHYAFEKLSKTKHPDSLASALVLGLTVWCIYVGDRLLDNRKTFQADTPRHAFHAQYEAILIRCMLGCLAVVGVLLFFLPKAILLGGSVLGVLVAIYLWTVSKASAQSRIQLWKEPLTAFIYASSVFGLAVIEKQALSTIDVLFGIVFMLICFQNLLLFSVFEQKNTPKAYNLSTFWGIERSERVIQILFLTILITAFFLFVGNTSVFQKRCICTLTFMSGMLWYIIRHPEFFSQNDRYRWAADVVFLLAIWLI